MALDSIKQVEARACSELPSEHKDYNIVGYNLQAVPLMSVPFMSMEIALVYYRKSYVTQETLHPGSLNQYQNMPSKTTDAALV